MKNKFDPLILITSGNKKIKDAYNAGVLFGREKEREVIRVQLQELYSWIDSRVLVVSKQKNKKWYEAGYLDVKKMIKSILTPQL